MNPGQSQSQFQMPTSGAQFGGGYGGVGNFASPDMGYGGNQQMTLPQPYNYNPNGQSGPIMGYQGWQGNTPQAGMGSIFGTGANTYQNQGGNQNPLMNGGSSAPVGGYAPGQGQSGYNPLMFGGSSAPVGGTAPGQQVNPLSRSFGAGGGSSPPPSFGPFPPTQGGGGADYGSGTNPAWQNFLGGGATPNAANILDQRYQDYLRNNGAPAWTPSGGR